MTRDFSVRSFLSGDLIWGVKQSDPLGAIHPHKHSLPIRRKPMVERPRSRFLSEKPFTYLR